MASHQTLSGQRLTDQIKFDHTNLLYIINGEVSILRKQMSGQFSTLIISTVTCRQARGITLTMLTFCLEL